MPLRSGWSRAAWACALSLHALHRAPVARADVALPAIFGDHMVLQAGRPIPVWGSAAPGEQVTVEAAGARARAPADPAGRWRVELPPLAASGAFEVVVAGRNRVVFRDVVLGEVWLASGQSNMELRLAQSDGAAQALAQARDDRLRLFRVRHGETVPPGRPDVEGRWEVSSPEQAAEFSAVGYHFGKLLGAALGRPVGVIQAAWGGTPAEAWTSLEALRAVPELRALAQGADLPPAQAARAERDHRRALERWERRNRHTDPPGPSIGERRGFARPGLDTRDWIDMPLPAHWEDHGFSMDGAAWYRREVALPEGFAGRPLVLALGAFNDCGTVFVAGVRVGHVCRDTPEAFGKPQRFAIPAALTGGPTLSLALRVFDERGRGGLRGQPGELFLERADLPEGAERVRLPLAGTWKFLVETRLPQLDPDFAARPVPPPALGHPHAPGALYRTLIAPLVPYALAGVIWYQGEANAGRPEQYRALFPTLIRDWRKAWGQGDLPFLYVQLASFDAGVGRADHDWAALREAQLQALVLPRTGMAVAIDIGDPNDIHPRNKLEVARRLSLWALARVYRRPGAAAQVHTGPLYAGHVLEGGRVRVLFEHATGLRARAGDAQLHGFEVAGTDGRFHAARAQVEGEAVLVFAEAVARPVAVRYGWSDAPACNLTNGAGLPASPFRSDDWPYRSP